MWFFIYILGALALLGVLAAVIGRIRDRKMKRRLQEGEISSLPETVIPDSECCGAHEICEKESLLSAVSKEIVYYDDEELDRFAGRNSDTYTDEEVAEFGEVFYTLQETDVAGWVRSLQLRNIVVPDALKDEIILIVGERRLPDSGK